MIFDPKEIKAGDWLVPAPTWNLISESRDELHNPSKVLGVAKFPGIEVAFLVSLKGGDSQWFESSWFTAKVPAPEDSQ